MKQVEIDLSDFYRETKYRFINVGEIDTTLQHRFQFMCYYDNIFIASGNGVFVVSQGKIAVVRLFDKVTHPEFGNISSLLTEIKEKVDECHRNRPKH